MKSTCTATCSAADVICRTIELGVVITGAEVDGADRTVIFARPNVSQGFCPTCGAEGVLRDHVDRELVDIPMAGHATRLVVRVPRFRCVHRECERKVFQQRLECAEPGAKTTGRCARWILQRLAIDKMSISAVARQISLGWDLVNELALSRVREIVYDTPGFLDGVRFLGVDEHTWRHTRTGAENSVTILVDLTPAIEGTGPSRLLDMREGRSAKVLARWLDERGADFKSRIEVVTMDGFAGYRTATRQQLPDAIAVMDPYHVVALAGEKLTVCRQRIQQAVHGRRGRVGDVLYRGRKTMLTRRGLLTDRQQDRLKRVFAEHDQHVAIEVTWLFYQDIIDAYQHPQPKTGKRLMSKVIDTLRRGVPPGLDELAQLGRTLWSKRTEILAFFDHGGASNGPVEAINGRLEHLRGIALGFRNFAHYALRSLAHSGQLSATINAL